MKKLSWKKVGCLLLALLMAATMLATGVVAVDTDTSILDPNAAVSLTLHKRDMKSPLEEDQYGQNDGTVMDDPNGDPLPDVTFTVYKVDNDTATTEIPTGPDVVSFTGTTDPNGEVTFSTMKYTSFTQGRYLVVEDKHPDKVTKPAQPFLVDVPMTNPAGTGWLYDVHVYVKNETYLNAAQLTKTDATSGNQLANAVFKLERKVGNEWEVVREGLQTTDAGLIEVSGLIIGEYRFVETQAPDGYTLDTTPVEFTITQDNNYKVVAVTMDNDRNMDHPDVTAIEKDVTSAPAGYVVNWEFTAYVPTDIATYQAYSLSDTLEDARMSFNQESVVVKNNDTVLDESAYEVAFEGQEMTITFTDYTALRPGNVTVTFSTKNANTATGEFTNTATVHYQARDDESEKSKSDIAETTLYAIDVDKYIFLQKDQKLAGAEFALYLSEEDAKAGENAIATGKTEKDGSLEQAFAGLNAGTYYLVETKAPDGYKLAGGVKDITLADDIEAEDTFVYTAEVANSTLVSLPITGGIGTLIFTFSGIALMGAAALLYIRSRKKKATEA